MQKIIFFFLLTLFVMGCSHSYTHDFLITHSTELQNEEKKCQEATQSTPYCEMVQSTFNEFIDFVHERSENPEKFGLDLLAQQMLLIQMRDALGKERLSLAPAKGKAPLPEAELNAAQKKHQKSKEAYRAQQLKVDTLLAVISATSSPGL